MEGKKMVTMFMKMKILQPTNHNLKYYHKVENIHVGQKSSNRFLYINMNSFIRIFFFA